MEAKVGFLNMEKAYGRNPVEKGRLKMLNREAITDISRLLRKHARLRSKTGSLALARGRNPSSLITVRVGKEGM